MIDRDGSTVMSSLYYYGSMQADWSIHGGESAGVRGSGMIKALFFCFFLFFYIMYSLLRYKNSHVALAMV